MTRAVCRPRRRNPVSRLAVLDRRGQVWTRILDAAGRLMAERGVAALSIEQILLAAGVSRGTFYSYCRNKSDLLVALIEPVFEEGTRDLARQADEPAAGVVPGIVALYRGLGQRHRHALLRVYADDPGGERLYAESVTALVAP